MGLFLVLEGRLLLLHLDSGFSLFGRRFWLFYAAVGNVGFGFSGFFSVATFGWIVWFGLSLSIGLPTFLAAFVVVVSVFFCLAGVDSLFRLSVFLGGDLLGGTTVQFPSEFCIVVMPSVLSSVSANFPSRFMGGVESVLVLVFLTALAYELLEPSELLERLEWLEATDDASLSRVATFAFAELFEI